MKFQSKNSSLFLFRELETQNNPPVADFTFSPLNGNTDTVSTFDASSSYDNDYFLTDLPEDLIELNFIDSEDHSTFLDGLEGFE